MKSHVFKKQQKQLYIHVSICLINHLTEHTRKGSRKTRGGRMQVCTSPPSDSTPKYLRSLS